MKNREEKACSGVFLAAMLAALSVLLITPGNAEPARKRELAYVAPIRSTAPSRGSQTQANPLLATPLSSKPIKNKESPGAKVDVNVLTTLLTSLAAIYGLFFAILGVVVQVGTQQSLSLLRKVFPVGNYIAASLALLFLQSTSLILFNESYYFAYSLFIFNLTFLGWLTTHTIKSLDRTYIIDLIATKYFNV